MDYGSGGVGTWFGPPAATLTDMNLGPDREQQHAGRADRAHEPGTGASRTPASAARPHAGLVGDEPPGGEDVVDEAAPQPDVRATVTVDRSAVIGDGLKAAAAWSLRMIIGVAWSWFSGCWARFVGGCPTDPAGVDPVHCVVPTGRLADAAPLAAGTVMLTALLVAPDCSRRQRGRW